MQRIIESIRNDDAFVKLTRAIGSGNRIIATGGGGSAVSMLVAAMDTVLDRPIIIVCAHIDEAEDIYSEINAVLPAHASVFPALELTPGETDVSAELFAARSMMLRRIAGGECPRVLIAPIAALMQPVPSPVRLDGLVRSIAVGETIDPSELMRWMSDAGYERVDTIEHPGQFALRGGILDIYPPTGPGGVPIPVRMDFFGDELESLSEVDLDTMGSDRKIARVLLAAVGQDQLAQRRDDLSVLEYLPGECAAILAETFEIIEQGRGYYERITDGRSIFGPPAVLKILETRFHSLIEINQFSAGKAGADVLVDLPIESLPAFDRDTATAVRELGELCDRGGAVRLLCTNRGEHDRLGELVDVHAPGLAIERTVIDIRRGFVWEGSAGRFSLVPSGAMLHRSSVRRRVQKIRAGRAMDTFLDIAEGDYVVHDDHGIARFIGMRVMPAGGGRRDEGVARPSILGTHQTKKSKVEEEEYLTLEFAGRSKLHVPCSQIDLIQKYVGGFNGKPPLSSIGGKKWKSQKAKVSDSVKDLASEMLRVRAAREHMPGFRCKDDTVWMNEFESEFPYEETEDQLSALQEIKKDMTSSRPMDRLICGDVGFGKTEVAIRAAFKAVESGKQVAVLVPTTVLAEQHERSFQERFADYPFKIASLSRFKTPGEVRQTLKDAQLGRLDILIGTHRILSKDVVFADLGLVVIDEEQRFGVEHKERLLQLRLSVHVLTLSATPIPRTLHMSMLGLRDISSLTTPPVDRRAVVTEVIPYNKHRIQRAIQRELAREGQVYFVHNRVHNIESVADEIQQLAPNAEIVIGHGQMNPHDLEAVMLKFMRRRADILVSTTIIESGIDNPTANTMIINDADRFGLSDLHQLRGRVGRSHHRAYCYLLLPEDRTVKEIAQKRLKAIEQYSMLGAGFKIAMRDLEIRGAGNLLGAEQSGHIAAVGYEMYCQLLDDAVRKLTDSDAPEPVSHTVVDIGLYGLLPKMYIPSDARRLEAYRRLASATSQAAIDRVVEDLTSAYSAPPELARRMILRARVRAAAQRHHVRALSHRGEDIVCMTASPGGLANTLGDKSGKVRVVNATLAQTNARSASGEMLSEVYIRPYRTPRSPVQVAKWVVEHFGSERAVAASGGELDKQAGT